MSQFAFLQREWAGVFDAAAKAATAVHADPRTACFYARHALELTVGWAYKHDVGLERGAAKEAMARCIEGRTLSANQLELNNLVVDHLTEHGVMAPERLYESPFTDLSPRGPDGLFTSAEIDQLIQSLESVRAAAVAA